MVPVGSAVAPVGTSEGPAVAECRTIWYATGGVSRELSMSEPVLVTGCAGFIGYHMALRLLGQGRRVVGLDNLSPYYDGGLKRARFARLVLQPAFSFSPLDLIDADGIHPVFFVHRF